MTSKGSPAISRRIPNITPGLFVTKIISGVSHLRRFPEMGRVVPEANNSSIRELISGNYRIVYRIKGDAVEIITIYHGSRLLDPGLLN